MEEKQQVKEHSQCQTPKVEKRSLFSPSSPRFQQKQFNLILTSLFHIDSSLSDYY